MHSVVVFIFFNETTEHWKHGEEKHRTENNHPQLKGETRLPKYGSQSGTTNDSCL